MKNTYLRITDVLALGPINVDGLDIDTDVEVVVQKYGSNYSIDSSTFGEAPIYVQTAFGHPFQLNVNGASGAVFFATIEKAIHDKALRMATETPSYKFQSEDD